MNYKQYKNLIRSQAWVVAKKYNYDFEELLSEGNLIFVEARKKYNSNKGKFSTYLYIDLNYRLNDYIKKHDKDSVSIEDYLEEDKLDVNKIKTIMENRIYSNHMKKVEAIISFYDDAMNELSDNALQILDCIITTNVGRKPAYRSVYKYFKYFLGWKNKQIEKAWADIGKWWSSYNLERVYY